MTRRQEIKDRVSSLMVAVAPGAVLGLAVRALA